MEYTAPLPPEDLGLIQDAIAGMLDAAFVPIPVYFEPIAVTAGEEEPGLPDDYIFVDLVPVEMDTIGPWRTDMSVFVDIALHKKAENNREYRQLAMQIDPLFRPVFRFGDRAITVPNAKTKIVDRVLHYSFTVRYIPTQALPEQPGLVAMETLGTTVTIEKLKE